MPNEFYKAFLYYNNLPRKGVHMLNIYFFNILNIIFVLSENILSSDIFRDF